MLTVNDLHRAEELSSSSMGAVAGGMECGTAVAVASVYKVTGDILGILGDKDGQAAFYNHAMGVIQGGCT